MKGNNHWSYKPYRPFLTEIGDIYICRIAPSANAIHLEWLPANAETYEIFIRKRNIEAFSLVGKTNDTAYDITELDIDTDYEFYVSAGNKKSRVRLARCAKTVGTVVNYLHPDDEAYSFSGRYLCSPSLLRHPDGYLLSSMDVFEGNSPQNLTLIFRSDDNGTTWHYQCELMPCFWGKLFLHEGDVYMLSCSTEYGDLLIGKSLDGGKSFSAPVTLLRGSNGKSKNCGVHKNPQNVVYYKGRIYNTLEWGSWSAGYHAPMVMSCDENADLLNPENWEFTPPVPYDPSWKGVAKGPSSGNIEGTLVIDPEGKLLNIMRYDMSKTEPPYGLALVYEVDTADPSAPLCFSRAIEFPANHSKFMIKKDPLTGAYYTLASRILSAETRFARNLLSLMRSYDLITWEVVSDVLDMRESDPKQIGFQYVDFEIEGDDIIFLCRTAIGGARNYHDSNYQTFHRIFQFRKM